MMTLPGIAAGQRLPHAPQSFRSKLAITNSTAAMPDVLQLGNARTAPKRAPAKATVHAPMFAGGWFSSQAVTHGAPPHAELAEPVFREVEKTDEAKLSTARELSQWLTKLLQEKNARVAVISRNGTEQVQQHDKTGMAHSGIAVYHPEEKTWHVYNLINHVQGAEPQAGIWKSTLEDFFYEQPGNKKDALVMIPPRDVQEKMHEAIQTGKYKPLYFTRDYNLVSAPHTPRSLNCNKWVLMNMMAAQHQTYHPPDVLKAIETHFKPAVVNVHPILRPFAKRQPIIIGDEVPAWDPIHTVSVESLYHSGLFEEKHFYSKRELEPRPQEEPSSGMSGYAPVIVGGLVILPLLGYAARNYLLKGRLLSRR